MKSLAKPRCFKKNHPVWSGYFYFVGTLFSFCQLLLKARAEHMSKSTKASCPKKKAMPRWVVRLCGKIIITPAKIPKDMRARMRTMPIIHKTGKRTIGRAFPKWTFAKYRQTPNIRDGRMMSIKTFTGFL